MIFGLKLKPKTFRRESRCHCPPKPQLRNRPNKNKGYCLFFLLSGVPYEKADQQRIINDVKQQD